MTDNDLELLEKLEAWQLLEDKKPSFDEIATIVLQFNRNRILNQNLTRSRNLDKLKYEVKKIVDYKKQAISDAQNKRAVAFEEEVVTTIFPIVEKLPEEKEKLAAYLEKGKRTDHAQLPKEVQALYDGNKAIYERMSFCHMKAKSLNDKLPCDRYPFIKELKELKSQLDANYTAYDNFGKDETSKTDDVKSEIVVDAKRIGNNRKYISDNKPKLAALKEKNPDKYTELFDKMQERITELVNIEAGMDASLVEELISLGFILDKTEANTSND